MRMQEMRLQDRLYEMTDRELRAYKRKLRHKREIRRKCIILAATLCLILFGSISYHAIQSSANNGEEALSFKYYTNVTVAYGETLWSLADDYIDYNNYKDKNTYIAEVCSINHLADDADIQAGQSLIVPYYSAEFVK